MIRKIIAEDIPMINEWFKARKFPSMEHVLPSLGFLMFDALGQPVSACFIYRDVEGRVCWLAWLVTRPGLSPRTSQFVLQTLVTHAEKEMADLGYPLILATGRRGLAKLFTGLKWSPGDMNVNQYFKALRRNYGT